MSVMLCHVSALEVLSVLRVCDASDACKDPSARRKAVRLDRCRETPELLKTPSKTEIEALFDGPVVPDAVREGRALDGAAGRKPAQGQADRSRDASAQSARSQATPAPDSGVARPNGAPAAAPVPEGPRLYGSPAAGSAPEGVRPQGAPASGPALGGSRSHGVPVQPARFAHLSAPAHVLVGLHADRRRSDRRVMHRMPAALPPKSLVRVAPGLLVASPEWLFLQMARGMGRIELLWFCCELMATYVIALSPEGSVLLPAYPLTTKPQLAAYLEEARALGVSGARKALEAVRHALEFAASPPEIELALLMTLPCAMGGRAVPQPRLNHRINADRRVVAARGPRHFVADACWPEEKLVVEYDGDAVHLDSAQRAKDNDRTAALEQMGYSVIHVSTGQLKSLSLVDAALKRVSNRLGRHTRDGVHAYDWQARRSELYLKLHRLATHGIDWAHHISSMQS